MACSHATWGYRADTCTQTSAGYHLGRPGGPGNAPRWSPHPLSRPLGKPLSLLLAGPGAPSWKASPSRMGPALPVPGVTIARQQPSQACTHFAGSWRVPCTIPFNHTHPKTAPCRSLKEGMRSWRCRPGRAGSGPGGDGPYARGGGPARGPRRCEKLFRPPPASPPPDGVLPQPLVHLHWMGPSDTTNMTAGNTNAADPAY